MTDASWSYSRRRALGFAGLFTGPALWWATVLLAPYALMFAISFYSKQFPFMIPDFQFGNYIKLFSENQYYTVLLRSLKVAFFVSCLAFVLGYPLSYFLVFIVRSPRLRLFLYVATIIPLWVSYLLRALYLENDPRDGGNIELIPDPRRDYRGTRPTLPL